MSNVIRRKAHVPRTFGLMKRGERMRIFTIKAVIPLTRTALRKKLRVFKIFCGPKSKEVMERKESTSKGIGRRAAHTIGDVARRGLRAASFCSRGSFTSQAATTPTMPATNQVKSSGATTGRTPLINHRQGK